MSSNKLGLSVFLGQCSNSDTMHSDDEALFAKSRLQEKRRVARLYGGKNIRHSSTLQEDGRGEDAKPSLTNNTSQKKNYVEETKDSVERLATPKLPVQKFLDRPEEQRRLEIHADNYHIKQPWFVGYQNSSSLQGSPLAIASRYGYNGAIKITKQCSDRVSTADLESAHILSMPHGNEGLRSDLAHFNEWTPPLTCGEFAGGCNFTSSPKLWPERPSMKNRSTENKNKSIMTQVGYTQAGSIPNPVEACAWTRHLKRVVDRELDTWKRVSLEAKQERRNTNGCAKKSMKNKVIPSPRMIHSPLPSSKMVILR